MVEGEREGTGSMSRLMRILIITLGIFLFFQFFSILPVDGVNISVSQTTVQTSHPMIINITDLQDGASFRIQVEGNMTVPRGERFSVDIINLTLPFSLRSATFTGVLEGSTNSTLTVQKGEYQITRTGGGFVTSTIPFPVNGTFDHILLQGTSVSGPVYMAPQISGIKEGPEDSQISLAVEGIEGNIKVRIFVNDEPAFDEEFVVTPTPEPVTPGEVVGSMVLGTAVGLAGAAAASTATSAGSGMFWVVAKGASVFLKDYVSENLEERLSDFETKRRSIAVNLSRGKGFLGFTKIEAIVTFFGALLFGLATFIAYKAPFTLDNIIIYVIAAGVAIMVHEIAHWHIARRKERDTDIQFWGLGTIIMFLTAWLAGSVFGQPCRTIISDVDSMEDRDSGEIMLAGPLVSVGIAALSVPLFFAGGQLAQIGRLAIIMNLVLATYHMMPFPPMDGKFIYKWNKLIWVGVFIPIAIMYIFLLLYLI